MAWLPLVSPTLETDLDSLLLLQSFSQPIGVLCFFCEAPSLPDISKAGLWLYSSPFTSQDKQIIVLYSSSDGLPGLECLSVLVSSQVVGEVGERLQKSVENVRSV